MVAGTSAALWSCHTWLPGCSCSRKFQWLWMVHPTAKQLEEGEKQRRHTCSRKHISIFLPGFSQGKNLDPMIYLLDGRECTQLKFNDIMHICIGE